MSALAGFSTLMMLASFLIFILIAVLWVLMPFAIFGTKDIVRALLAEQRKTNKLLQDQADRAKAIREASQALPR